MISFFLCLKQLIWFAFFHSVSSFTFLMFILISGVGYLVVSVIETKLPFHLCSSAWRIHFNLTFFRGNFCSVFLLLFGRLMCQWSHRNVYWSAFNCFIAHLFYLPLKIIHSEHSCVLSGSKPLLFQNGKICLLEVSLDVLNNTKEVIKLEVERTWIYALESNTTLKQVKWAIRQKFLYPMLYAINHAVGSLRPFTFSSSPEYANALFLYKMPRQ